MRSRPDWTRSSHPISPPAGRTTRCCFALDRLEASRHVRQPFGRQGREDGVDSEEVDSRACLPEPRKRVAYGRIAVYLWKEDASLQPERLDGGRARTVAMRAPVGEQSDLAEEVALPKHALLHLLAWASARVNDTGGAGDE